MKCLRLVLVVSLVLQGCGEINYDTLNNVINKSKIIVLQVESYGSRFECEPTMAQEVLKAWAVTLNKSSVPSLPNPDEYLNIILDSEKVFRLRISSGIGPYRYSVLRIDSVYVGEPLRLEAACPGLESHNKSLSTDALSRAG